MAVVTLQQQVTGDSPSPFQRQQKRQQRKMMMIPVKKNRIQMITMMMMIGCILVTLLVHHHLNQRLSSIFNKRNEMEEQTVMMTMTSMITGKSSTAITTTTTTSTRKMRKRTAIAGRGIPKKNNTGGNSKINYVNNNKPLLPNVLIIGAQKAGSTALSDWLFSMGVCGASTTKDEPHFYKKESHYFDNDERFARGSQFYKQRYSHCGSSTSTITTTTTNGNNRLRKRRIISTKLRLDATPTTMQHPERVYETYKNVRNITKLRIIVSLREPISRELSLYNHQLSQYRKNPNPNMWYANVMKRHDHLNYTQAKTFDEFVETVTIPNLLAGINNSLSASSLAYYSYYLKRWYTYFDPQQILVLSYEQDIRREPSNAKAMLRKFLNYPLPTKGPFPVTNTHASQSKVKTISCKIRNKLQTIYEPWNQELYELLYNQSMRITSNQIERPTTTPFPPFTLPDCVDDNDTETDNTDHGHGHDGGDGGGSGGDGDKDGEITAIH